MISKMGYKTLIMEALSEGSPFICFGSQLILPPLFQKYSFKKVIAVALETVVNPDAIICISSVTAIPVLSVINSENSWHLFSV
jgi:hypothetical protein